MARRQQHYFIRLGAVILSCVLACEGLAGAQTKPSLKITVIEGTGATNNILAGPARNPVVEVRDESDNPVAGAKVTFVLPERGPGGTFFGAGTSVSVTSDQQGRAIGAGFRPNETEGRFQIQVTATQGDRMGTATIGQRNLLPSGDVNAAANTGKKFSRNKIIAIVIGGAIAGAIIAAHGDGSSTTTTPGTSITPGTVTVGIPR